jgi:hypothetical protein
LLQFSVKGKDLKVGLASAGLLDKTTAGKQGEPLDIPVVVAFAATDGKKYVYIVNVSVI